MAVRLTTVLRDCFDISLCAGGHLSYLNTVKAKPKWNDVHALFVVLFLLSGEQSHAVVTALN